METLDFEYFCGANVVIEVNGIACLEAAALQYSIGESKVPIYGYSERHFNAVASGQVLVQGSIVVNMVHHDYLLTLINGAFPKPVPDIPIPPPTTDAQIETARANILSTDNNMNTRMAAIRELQNAVWTEGTSPGTVQAQLVAGTNVHDLRNSIDLKITFGERNLENGFHGKANRYIADVFFTGESSEIQIDENTIVEMYSFFARDIYSYKPTRR